MAKPQFTKTANAYTPFVFEKARFLPANQPITPRQLIGIAGGGRVKVTDLGDPDEFFEIRINRISKTNRDNLLGFLQDATVNYSLYTFTFVDEDSASHTVRLWDSEGLDFPKVRGGLYNIKLLLRKEIT
jgi:hypothetical protein